MPVATLRSNGAGGVILYYVHTDHLNTPRLVTDTANNIRWRWDSDPFGTTLPDENPSGLGLFTYNLRFPGQQYDSVVGLNYNYFRDYDLGTGRYLQSDPIGLGGGLNTYLYVRANSIGHSDPLGLQTVVLPWGAGLSQSVRPFTGTIDWGMPYVESGQLTWPPDPNGCDPCKGIYNKWQEHEKKLAAYKDNPLAWDNKLLLQMALIANRSDWFISIYERRIKRLRHVADEYKKQYDECSRRYGA